MSLTAFLDIPKINMHLEHVTNSLVYPVAFILNWRQNHLGFFSCCHELRFQNPLTGQSMNLASSAFRGVRRFTCSHAWCYKAFSRILCWLSWEQWLGNLACWGWWPVIWRCSWHLRKKGSPRETPENNDWELNFSSSEIIHICVIFSTVLFYFPIYLKRCYILGFKQLILDKYNYNWMEQTNIVLRGHCSGYSEAWKQNSHSACIWKELLKW